MVWNQRVLAPGWEADFHAVQYPDDGVRVGVDLVSAQGESAYATRPFGPREVFRTTWTRTVGAEDHRALYTTQSPFLVATPAEQAERLARWDELLA